MWRTPVALTTRSARGEGLVKRCHVEAGVECREGRHRVRVHHSDARPQRPDAAREALAHGAEAHHHGARGLHEVVPQQALEGCGAGLARAVAVVEAALELGVVDVRHGERQVARGLHDGKGADAGGRLLGHAGDARCEVGAFHDGQAGEVRAVVDHQVRLQAVQQAQDPGALGRGVPTGVRLHHKAAACELCGHALVALVGVAVHAHLRPGLVEAGEKDRGLWLHDEREGDAAAGERPGLRELLRQRGRDGHAGGRAVDCLGAGERGA